jgi:fatty acid desaturase
MNKPEQLQAITSRILQNLKNLQCKCQTFSRVRTVRYFILSFFLFHFVLLIVIIIEKICSFFVILISVCLIISSLIFHFTFLNFILI